MTVTVVVPTHDRRPVLARTLASILGQREADVRVVARPSSDGARPSARWPRPAEPTSIVILPASQTPLSPSPGSGAGAGRNDWR